MSMLLTDMKRRMQGPYVPLGADAARKIKNAKNIKDIKDNNDTNAPK